MAKKYLSLEEAASLLDITTDQLMKIREKGDIRGFADRGSWKFREQDIDEFQRSRQADSSPDFPIITLDSSSSVLEEPEAADLSSSDSDVRLFFDKSLFDDQDAKGLAASGSDVRLSGDSGPNLEQGESDDALDLSGWGSDAKISDSDSDVKLVGARTQPDIDLGATFKMTDDSDSDVVMVTDTDSEINLTADSELRISDSDSDVRLTTDEDSDSDVQLSTDEDSDSDVQLSTDEDSDSDVQLADNSITDNDVLAATALLGGIDSDSDVKLMGKEDLLLPDDDSDSDVKLSANMVRTDSDIRLAKPSPAPTVKPTQLQFPPDDSDLKLINKGSGVRKNRPDSGTSLDVRGSGLGLDADESGISLEIDSGISLDANDSGISLEGYDSGISLDANDSGISLEGYDSGTNLRDDSGISLEGFESATGLGGDSGIALDGGGDSDISLDLGDDSGISVKPDDMGRTVPMQAIPGAKAALSDSTAMTTQFEIPKVAVGNDSEFELAGLDDEDDEVGAGTGILKFDDDEELDSSRTVAVPALVGAGAAVQDKDAVDEFEDEEGADDGEYGEYEEEGDLDVHDSEEFEDGDIDSGQVGSAGFPVPMRVSRADVDWSIGTKIMIGISALVSVMCAVVGIELVRTMWLWTQPSSNAPVSSILQMIGGAF